MSLALFNLMVDVAEVVCAALLAARMLIAARRSANAWLIAAICVGTICHQLLSRQEFAPFDPDILRTTVGGWAAPLNLARNATPGLFMVLAHRMFVDGRPVPRWLLGLFGLQLLLEITAYGARLAPVAAAAALLQLLFGALTLGWTLTSWSNDLVETRRRSRAVVFAIVALNMVASSLLLRLLIPGGSASYGVHVALSMIGLAVTLGLLLRSFGDDIATYVDPGRVRPVAPARPGSRAEAEDAASLAALDRLIEQERIFLEPGLTLGALAGRVLVPEYRLRRLIHERLGYPTFNAFLHTLRVREACRQFDDPAHRRTPILTIALSVGYNSVNTFNRGFREVTGVTPSAYRTELTTRKSTPESENPSQLLQSASPLQETARP